jgi:hypothetical protein
MKCTTTAVLLVLAMVAADAAAPDRDGKRWQSFVEMLANDDMQGRDTGSPAHRKAADLVAAEFLTSRISVMPFARSRNR